MSIKILVDSASDISLIEAKKMKVEMIPMQITFDQEEYYDGVDLLPNMFYEKLIETDVLPKTSQINPFRFEEAYEKLTSLGHEVIVITISSKLSNTYNNAYQASLNYKDKVFVIDSLNATVSERLLVEYGLSLIDKGLKVKEIVEELERVKSKLCIIAVVDTLEYLKKGGRISKITALAGELFAIKPVLSLVDGEIKMIGKARGSLNEMIKGKGIDFTKPIGTLYSGLSDVKLQKYIKDNHHLYDNEIKEIPIHILGSTIGTHVGPGAVGVAFFTK